MVGLGAQGMKNSLYKNPKVSGGSSLLQKLHFLPAPSGVWPAKWGVRQEAEKGSKPLGPVLGI